MMTRAMALPLRWKRGRGKTRTFWWRLMQILRQLEHLLVSEVDQQVERVRRGSVETYSSTTGKRDSRCDSRASTLGKTAYPTRPVSKLYEQEKATKGRT